jgi:hypothetical protein
MKFYKIPLWDIFYTLSKKAVAYEKNDTPFGYCCGLPSVRNRTNHHSRF